MKETISAGSFFALFGKTFRFFSFCRKNLLALFLLNFISSLFFLAGPYLSRSYIDRSFLLRDFANFLRISVIGIIIFLGSTLASLAEETIRNQNLVKIKLKLSRRFVRKIFSLDISYFHRHSTGENIYRFSSIEEVTRLVGEHFPKLIVDIIKLVIILGIAFWINSHLTFMLLILSPLILFQNIYFRKKVRPLYSELWEFGARFSKRLQESLSKMELIHILNLKINQSNFCIRILVQQLRLNVKRIRWFVLYSLTSTVLSKVIYGLLSLYGGWMIIKEELSLGSFTAVMLYLTQAGGLFNSLSYRMEYLIQQGIALEKFFEIMEKKSSIYDKADARELKKIEKEISFQEIYFEYEKGRPVFSDFDLTLPLGKWIGIVGPSGSGKTTLVNLLVRLYEPQGGAIFLDSENIRNFKIDSLRERISLVTQEPFLFDLSIKDNLCIGLKEVNQMQLQEVLEIVQLYDFVRKLPFGLDTILGENACCLSEGQKQKVSLARSILRRPDILILDEATSSIDSSSEAKIFSTLRKKREGLTTIIISHRLSAVKDAEIIFLFAPDGKTESGTHAELLAKSSNYQNFFQGQIEN